MNKKQIRNTKKYLARTLIALLATGFVSYAYAITHTTVTISSSQSLTKKNQEIRTELSQLELEYFEIVNNIDINEASEGGFAKAEKVYYAQRSDIQQFAFNY